MPQGKISTQTLCRLPLYLNYLRALPKNTHYVSATQIACAIGLGDVQVRKDLASVSGRGRPKTGYEVRHLVCAVENLLASGETQRFCIVGMGHLGTALAGYQGFADYGLQLAAAFDIAPQRVGKKIAGITVMPVADMETVCTGLDIQIGVIAVPQAQAQEVCNILVGAGIGTVWNFAPTYLAVPRHVHIRYENMAAQLSMLGRHMQ